MAIDSTIATPDQDDPTRRRKALVVDDAPDILTLLCETLRQAGFDPTGAATGTEALRLARRLQPDLVTLDITLPDIDGIEVCRRLRESTNAYVIMLTARIEETDRLIALETCADDFMLKPFSPRELRARVGAMFRRPRLADPGEQDATLGVLRSGDLVVDREGREVTLAGTGIALTRTEFDLLVAFMSRPRRVWDRETLARHLGRTDWPGAADHLIDVHVANLRHKLGIPRSRGSGCTRCGEWGTGSGVRRRSRRGPQAYVSGRHASSARRSAPATRAASARSPARWIPPTYAPWARAVSMSETSSVKRVAPSIALLTRRSSRTRAASSVSPARIAPSNQSIRAASRPR